MASPTNNRSKKARFGSDDYEIWDEYDWKLDLRFLGEQILNTGSFRKELRTAKEKARYYEDLIKNDGKENAKKMARDCKKRIAQFKKQIIGLNALEALPLHQTIRKLEHDLRSYEYRPLFPAIYDKRSLVRSKSDIERLKCLNEMRATWFPPLPNSDSRLKTFRSASHSKTMRELRIKACFWKNIHKWNKNERWAYYYVCGPENPTDYMDALFVRGQKDEQAVARKFVDELLTCEPGRILMLQDAYTAFCSLLKQSELATLKRSDFKAMVVPMIKDEFNVALRNDLVVEGRQGVRGWKNVRLSQTMPT